MKGEDNPLKRQRYLQTKRENLDLQEERLNLTRENNYDYINRFNNKVYYRFNNKVYYRYNNKVYYRFKIKMLISNKWY